jgi:hypothetical protein
VCRSGTSSNYRFVREQWRDNVGRFRQCKPSLPLEAQRRMPWIRLKDSEVFVGEPLNVLGQFVIALPKGIQTCEVTEVP